jgi:hypothetical protein
LHWRSAGTRLRTALTQGGPGEKIVAAQQANDWDMGGHAQKAQELLDQVNRELKEAAEAANRHER